MPRYFMRDTPLQAMEQLMMSQPGQKPRGGGIYRSPFRYTPEDVACEYCQNYVRKHPCRLCECTCLEERIEAGVFQCQRILDENHQQPGDKKQHYNQLFFREDIQDHRWRWASIYLHLCLGTSQ